MIFVESPIFSKLLNELLSDEDYSLFQQYMITNPLAGDVIQNTDGLRKVRWFAGNKGKRGGVRVIYYYLDESMQIRLLLIYKKGAKDDLTPKEKAVLREIKARWR
jgi:mRNA-degrading endonuclease RelE of RelBE toxin-antitoxin system